MVYLLTHILTWAPESDMGYQLILHKILIKGKKIGHSNQYFFHDQCVIKENNDVAECLHRKKIC